MRPGSVFRKRKLESAHAARTGNGGCSGGRFLPLTGRTPGRTLDAWIAGNQKQNDALLLSYKVPLVDATGHVNSLAKDGKL